MIEPLAGAAGGGILGQLGDALSAPRRALWGALGGPESGADLVNQLTGIDRESLLGQGLGFGAEVLGDPLTYAGGILGKLLGKGISAGGKALRGTAGADAVAAGRLGEAAAPGAVEAIQAGKSPLAAGPGKWLDRYYEAAPGIEPRGWGGMVDTVEGHLGNAGNVSDLGISKAGEQSAHIADMLNKINYKGNRPAVIGEMLDKVSTGESARKIASLTGGDLGFMTKASYAPGAKVAAGEAVSTKATPLADLLETMAANEAKNPIGFKDVMKSRRRTPVLSMADGYLEQLPGPGLENFEKGVSNIPKGQRQMLKAGTDAITDMGAQGVYSNPYVAPETGPRGVVLVNRNLPPEVFGQTKRHELSHALTSNATEGTARRAVAVQQGLAAKTADEVAVARMVDETLANAVAKRNPYAQSGNAQSFLEHGRAEPYLRELGLIGTPYENFAMNVAPRTIESVRRNSLSSGGLPRSAGLLEYLQALAKEARARQLGVAAPLAGGGLAAMLAGGDRNAV
jgi:hypothetical protein